MALSAISLSPGAMEVVKDFAQIESVGVAFGIGI